MQDVFDSLLTGSGYVLLLLGLIGAVVPVLPGPLLIWGGALLWAWGNGFERIGWPTLALLGFLAVAAWMADLFLSTIISRRSGASWKAIGGAIVGGIAGGVLLSGAVPFLGTIVGAILGAVIGTWAVEFADKRSIRTASAAVRAYITSLIFAALLEMTVALMMLAIFIWQAFL